MHKKALNKDIFKEFTKSITRFLSIMLMIALGSSIFVGMYVTGPTMRNTLLTYVDKYHLEDLTVTSPLGLTMEDKLILGSVPGIEILDYSYRTDLIQRNSDLIVRAESLGNLPAYEILEGRLPKVLDELALDGVMREKGYKLGDRISFVPEKVRGSYALKRYDFVIVGFVNSPEYLITSNKGTASIGDGVVDCFGVILNENFTMENVSLARLTFKDVKGLDSYSDEYKDKMKAHADGVEQAFASRPEIRLEQYRKEGLAEISTAQGEISNAEKQLQAAKKKLDEASVALFNGWAVYQEGKSAFDTKISAAQAKITAGQEELIRTKATLDDGYARLVVGEKKLSDSKAVLADSEAKLADARQQLADGQKQLDDAQKKINDDRTELAAKTTELYDQLFKLDDGLIQINAGLAEIDTELAQIGAAQAQVEAGLQQADAGIVTLVDGISQIGRQLQDLDKSLDAVNASLTALDDWPDKNTDWENQMTALNAQKAQLLQTKADLEQKRADLAAQKTDLDAKKAFFLAQQTELLYKNDQGASQKAALQEQKSALLAQRQTVINAIRQLGDAQAELNDGQQKLDAQRAAFNVKKAEYEDGITKLEEGRIKLANGQAELDKARAELAIGQARYNDGTAKLEESRATLAIERTKGENELKLAYQKILDGEVDYEKGRREYIDKLPAAQKSIEQGKAELNQAKNELARIKVPDYIIHDRYKDMGFYQFIQNSESMDLLSLFFPVFFFLIALLVSLTTMTRMVDEQRLQIGTLKALGYSNGDVIKKYLAYGSLASLSGSLIGIVVGQRILMPVIFDAYSSNFLFQQELPLLSPVFSLIAVLISLFCTGFIALLTSRESLKDNVAALLRPKAPESGNRILLERFTPLWQRLSFNNKVTTRNIFRYKKRMLMTILGVTGCSALIFFGFGIRDSVSSLFVKQYGEIFRYDTVLIFDENAAKEELQAFKVELESDSRIAGIYPARFEQGIVQIPGQLDQNVSIVVPEDEAAFRTINQLRERKSKAPIALNDGAVITEKIAILLKIGEGDELEFKDNDGTFKTIIIAGITENYAGHYVYMAPNYYEEIFGEKYRPNSDYILLRDQRAASVSLFSRNMLEKNIVLSTINTNASSNVIGDLTQSLNIVVLVLILASSLLAMVVLYNLTNINVSERIRELSTIIVLGFYPREVTAYVYRETMILTAIGIITGYIFGLLLHRFIVTALPPASVLFDPAVKPSSYIWAAAFTFAFSLVVMLIMHRRLKRINMVEALKAVE